MVAVAFDEGGELACLFEAEPFWEVGVDGGGCIGCASAFEFRAAERAVIVDAADAEFVDDESDGGGEHGFVPPFAGEAEVVVPVIEDECGIDFVSMEAQGFESLAADSGDVIADFAEAVVLDFLDQGFAAVPIEVDAGPCEGAVSAFVDGVPTEFERIVFTVGEFPFHDAGVAFVEVDLEDDVPAILALAAGLGPTIEESGGEAIGFGLLWPEEVKVFGGWGFFAEGSEPCAEAWFFEEVSKAGVFELGEVGVAHRHPEERYGIPVLAVGEEGASSG